MLCKVCRRCGLCAGPDELKTFSSQNVCLSTILPHSFKAESGGSSCDIGIAFDLGTTTIAAAAFSLQDGMLLAQKGETNAQVPFGADCISRISFAASGGLQKLHAVVSSQLASIAQSLLMTIAPAFLSQRRGRPQIKKIVIAGNTVMQSLAAGLDVQTLGVFPFTPPSYFGKTFDDVFNGTSLEDCGAEVFFAPAVSGFIGGDALCSALSCGLVSDTNAFLADVGTNCEMAAYNSKTQKLLFASSAAGPAFEGYGISCGSSAKGGAVSRVYMIENNICCSVIGGGSAQSICGTGVLSAVSAFLKAGIIDCHGTIANGSDFINIGGSVRLTQQDIRNFQLAKAAVMAGLTILSHKAGVTSDADLYLAGGFGSSFSPQDAASTGMIPRFLSSRTLSCGNASLSGAAMILLSSTERQHILDLAAIAEFTELAVQDDFQEVYIKSLEFDV